MVDKYQHDANLIMSGTKPRYLVVSMSRAHGAARTYEPFVSTELAISHHIIKQEQNFISFILDLTEYDWDENPLDITLVYTGGNLGPVH